MKKKRFLQLLASELLENRSDISELISTFLEDQDSFTEESFEAIESRFIYAEIPPEDRSGALKIEYDTLTTELAYLTTDGTWKHCINHVYQHC